VINPLDNPKTTSLGLGAVMIGVSCWMGWLDHQSGQIAIFALLGALGILAKDA
jgi:hypothetical protein